VSTTPGPTPKPAADYVRVPISRWQGRSTTMTTGGIVASEHPLASQAGAMVLAAGGHAVDAAIAANAVMGVVAPMMDGVGGDLFAIVHEPSTGAITGINASGWASEQASIAGLRALGFETMPQSGVHSVTVPGAVAGWSALHGRFGRSPWTTLFDAAIHCAEDGFPVAELTAREWASMAPILQRDAQAASTFLPGGAPPPCGARFRNPDLASVYRDIAVRGRDGFYGGVAGARIVSCLTERGAAMTADDLVRFEPEWVTPISTSYRGWDVYEIPPNSQGVAALAMLNIAERFPLGTYGAGSADALHVLIEAKKLAFADMRRYVGDPRFGRIPVEEMLSKAYAAERAALIDPRRAAPGADPGILPSHGGDTTYLCVVDAQGNICSLIQSNFANFGSGVVPQGCGFVLQSRGGLFSLDATHPNGLAPRKRPLQTVIPALMRRGPVTIGFGVMGGWNQPQAHAQVVSNLVDHGYSIQEAIEAPRFAKLTFDGTDVMVESRVGEEARRDLAARGHDIDLQGPFSSMMGGGQAVAHDASTAVNLGASDPRKDGAAVPEPLGPARARQ
jgi:gamma-glutamyltranspeptidase/glutathione hydrolase